MRKIYRGPANSRGEALYDGAPLPGSELAWIGPYVTQDGGPSALFKSMTDMFRNLAYPRQDDRWTIRQIDWDTVSEQVSMAEAFYGAADPDLRRFKALGGKLIAYHGLTDPLVLPANYAAYYDTVQTVMGGPAATREFFRLFQVAGLNHCTGGAGAGVIDYLSYLEQWVEQGHAPDMMLATHLKGSDPADAAFTRPVFPYPLVTRYRGRGDTNAAASFMAATSQGR